MSRELVIVAIGAALFGVAVWARNPPGPSVGERLAAIEGDCVAKNSFAFHVSGVTRDQGIRLLGIHNEAVNQARRHCIGLALESDPEAAKVFTNVHGKVD